MLKICNFTHKVIEASWASRKEASVTALLTASILDVILEADGGKLNTYIQDDPKVPDTF